MLMLVNALLVLERNLTLLTIDLACQLYQTLIELMQGPWYAHYGLGRAAHTAAEAPPHTQPATRHRHPTARMSICAAPFAPSSD